MLNNNKNRNEPLKEKVYVYIIWSVAVEPELHCKLHLFMRPSQAQREGVKTFLQAVEFSVFHTEVISAIPPTRRQTHCLVFRL